ncbi:SDR family NAD(P)-dependent oxidoreductase [Sphingomonas immobilis]|uniref:SDR family oxidoreductase n=1 Tax=Sphingomonas immobilis TaxID=3063997 RepID=A0ABT8ZX88_9SPHN|nr:SDR family oxidoreductase [Sphingomonas sp. CA1-15]MDO7842190.1 SDR family oxidoreductase [Sphingomonas sp. CA1-15]
MTDYDVPAWLAGETAIVTGAGAGIGRATAVLLARAGAFVVAADRDLAAAEATVAAMGAGQALALDVADADAVRAAIAAVHDARGRIDILVNNAGVYPMVALDQLDAATWTRTLGINLLGASAAMQAAAAVMTAGARIVNISSIDSLRPSAPGLGHYGASKAALNALTRSAAVELGPRGIRVNALLPGVIATEGTSGSPPEYRQPFIDRAPARRLGAPDDIARAVLFLAGPLAAFVHGQQLVADGGLTING